jgi:hypothetical protein
VRAFDVVLHPGRYAYPKAVRAFDVVLHPGRYAYPKAARAARILNLAGVLLLTVGLIAVLYGLAQAVSMR